MYRTRLCIVFIPNGRKTHQNCFRLPALLSMKMCRCTKACKNSFFIQSSMYRYIFTYTTGLRFAEVLVWHPIRYQITQDSRHVQHVDSCMNPEVVTFEFKCELESLESVTHLPTMCHLHSSTWDYCDFWVISYIYAMETCHCWRQRHVTVTEMWQGCGDTTTTTTTTISNVRSTRLYTGEQILFQRLRSMTSLPMQRTYAVIAEFWT